MGRNAYPLSIDQHVDFEENDIVDGNVFIPVEDLEGFADCRAIDNGGGEDERAICKQRKSQSLAIIPDQL